MTMFFPSREDFSVPSSAAITFRHFVSHNHVVTGLDYPHKLEPLALSCGWPAALEVARPIQADIQRTGEGKGVGEGPLDQTAIACREGEVPRNAVPFCNVARGSRKSSICRSHPVRRLGGGSP